MPTQSETSELMRRFTVLTDGMSAKGMVLGTGGLEVADKVLRGPRGGIADRRAIS